MLKSSKATKNRSQRFSDEGNLAISRCKNCGCKVTAVKTYCVSCAEDEKEAREATLYSPVSTFNELYSVIG